MSKKEASQLQTGLFGKDEFVRVGGREKIDTAYTYRVWYVYLVGILPYHETDSH